MSESTGAMRRARAMLASVPRSLWTVLVAGILIAALSLALYLSARPAGPPTFREGALLDGEGPLAFSPDGGTLATGHHLRKSIRFWDVRTGELTRTIETPGEVHALAFSPDARTLATTGADQGVPLWDVRTGERDGTVGPRWASAIAFSPDGKALACGGSGGSTGRLGLWDVRSRRMLRMLRERDEDAADEQQEPPDDGWPRWTSTVYLLAFSPDGRLLASYHDGHLYSAVKLWDVRSGRLVRELRGASATVHGLAFLHGGRTVVAACGKRLLFWHVRDAEPAEERELPHSPARLAVSPDGRALAIGCWGEEGGLWDVKTGERLKTLDAPTPRTPGVAFSPEGTRLATVTGAGIQLWDVTRGR